MINKYTLYIILTLLLIGGAAFYAGRRTAPVQTKTEFITKVKVKTVVVKSKDGSTKTTTEVTTETDSKSSTKRPEPTRSLNVSGMISADTTGPFAKPVYGLSVDRQFIGPVTIGLYGLTNGIVGFRLGITF